MDLRQFHTAINSYNEPWYTPLRNGKVVGSRLVGRTITDLLPIAQSDPLFELGLIIPPNYIVIETKEYQVLKVIEDRKEQVVVFETPDGLQILAQSFFDKTTVNNTLACGVLGNTLTSARTKTVITLPFKTKHCTSKFLEAYSLVYAGEKIGFLPDWLEPIHKQSRPDTTDALVPPYTSFEPLIKKINQFNVVTREEVAKIINKYFMQTPLTDDELQAVLKNAAYINNKIFFDGNTFLHNVLGEYMINKCNIKRDKKTNLLYHYNEQEKIYEHRPEYLLGYMTRLVPTLKDYQKTEALKYIDNFLVMEPVEFNQDPYSIVFKNGILDVLTMEFSPMDETHMETIKLNVNYNPHAYHKTADEFFHTATQGDADIEELLYEAIGYSMLKTSELQSAFIMVGTGRNGKSTYLEVIRNILGKQNTTSISFKDLANNFRASALDGKLASLAGDISSTPISDSDMVKSIIAGEEIMVERKYKDAYDKSLFATMFFSANVLPRTPDTSDGFYRRFPIIPFTADLSKVSRVDGASFKRELLSQKSLDYIAYKAVVAINKVLEVTKEFTIPKAVKDMVQKYKTDNSSILSWFYDSYKNDINKIVGKELRNLYYEYQEWCDKNSFKHVRVTKFEEDFMNNFKIMINDKERIALRADIV